METHNDYSYGVIPFFKEEGSVKIFLINQYGSGGDVYWTFPKGHAEGDEAPVEAALRELHEETQIVIEQLKEDKVYMQEYSFKAGDVLINKKVEYYLGQALSKDFTIQEEEVKEAGWFDAEEALLKLTFGPSREMLRQALNDLT